MRLFDKIVFLIQVKGELPIFDFDHLVGILVTVLKFLQLFQLFGVPFLLHDYDAHLDVVEHNGHLVLLTIDIFDDRLYVLPLYLRKLDVDENYHEI